MSGKNDINRRVLAIQAKKKRHRNGKGGKGGIKSRGADDNNSGRTRTEGTHHRTRGRDLQIDDDEDEEILGNNLKLIILKRMKTLFASIL